MRWWRSGLFSASLLAVGLPGAAQTWSTTTEDYLTDQIRGVVATHDGRFLGVADTGRALALIKRNSDGSLLWQRLVMGFPTGEAGSDVLELRDGRIVAAGDASVDAHGDDDMFLAVLSADARTVLLQRAYGGSEGQDRALDLVPSQDGGYLLVGQTTSWGSPGWSMLAVKVDSALALEWARAFGSATTDDVLRSGVQLPTGEFLVAGSSGSVLRVGTDGTLLWARSYGLTEIREVVTAQDGDVVLAGWRAIGDDDVAEIVKLVPTGEILWRASYGAPGIDYRFFALTPLDDGGFLAGGEVNGPDLTLFDGWIARLGSVGEIVWQRHLDDGAGEVHALSQAQDGSLLVGGHRQSFPKMALARLDASGLAGGCSHPATQAVRIDSGATWTAESPDVIDAASLVVTATDFSVSDSANPEDLSVCEGGLTLPPSEVSPPAASSAPLSFEDAHTLAWEDAAPSASATFDLYRGDLDALRAGIGLDCHLHGLATSSATDFDEPVAGRGFGYLVGGRNDAGVGTLGHDSDGSERVPARACASP